LIELGLKLNPLLKTSAQEDAKKAVENEERDLCLCTRCGSRMVLRRGPKGEFYGCSSFPKCRNTLPISQEA